MSRLRLFVPGLSHHVYHRGNDSCPVFHDEHDRRTFLQMLHKVSISHAVAIHGYVLMTTHYHAQVTAFDALGLPRTMQNLGRKYVRYFNKRHRRKGTLWEGRYHASLIGSERYWLTCLRYIELNPVRAGLVTSPGDYQWSSHRAHARGADDPLLTSHALYLQLGETISARADRWAEWCGKPTQERDLTQIRLATWRGVRVGIEERAATPVHRAGQADSAA